MEDEPAGLIVGPLAVATDGASIDAFARVTGVSADGVPATYPIVWLAHPEVRSAILDIARDGEFAFHEDQSFDYRARLQRDAAYVLTLEIARQDEPARVQMIGTVAQGEAPVMTMRTLLRLVAAPVADTMAGAQQQ